MTFTLHWPQLIWIGFLIVSLCVDGVRHGKPKSGKYDIYSSLVAYAINIALLYWGGFFGR